MRRSNLCRADFGRSFIKLCMKLWSWVIFEGACRPLRIGLRHLVAGIVTSACCLGFAAGAAASPSIVIDVATGDVFYAEQAVAPWYPASLTKLMTFYVAMSAVRDQKISLDTPIVISRRAARAAPSKMGFPPGTQVTLSNALKMMVVKSANDIAVAVAEAVDGSVEAFAEDMNAAAAELGMRQSHFVNPNGLQDPQHVSSAHDLAILARAIFINFPHASEMFAIGALRLDDDIIATHNTMLGRYPGADGMKTGFTCSSGFNIVVSAQRNGHRYLAVVLGAPSVPLRTVKTAALLDRAFDGVDHPQGKLEALDSPSHGTPPDMHSQVCHRRAKAAGAFQAEIAQIEAPLLTLKPAPQQAGLALFAVGTPAEQMTPVAPTIAMLPRPVFDPVPVYLGPAPGYQGPVATARPPHSPIGTPPSPETASDDEAEKPQAVTASKTKAKKTAASDTHKAKPPAKHVAQKKPQQTAAKKPEAKHVAASPVPPETGSAQPNKATPPAGQ
jgi:D-alanyl-D-alanine carboxypeptidase